MAPKDCALAFVSPNGPSLAEAAPAAPLRFEDGGGLGIRDASVLASRGEFGENHMIAGGETPASEPRVGNEETVEWTACPTQINGRIEKIDGHGGRRSSAWDIEALAGTGEAATGALAGTSSEEIGTPWGRARRRGTKPKEFRGFAWWALQGLNLRLPPSEVSSSTRKT
jgi:hypothetical protein